MANNYKFSNYELNYVTANRFYVEIESKITASFSECSGFGVTVKTEKYLEGGANDQQRVILGQPEFSDVTLKRGITDSFVFWNWVNQTTGHGKIERRNINILLYNQAGKVMQCWTLIGAVPVGWRTADLQASANNVALEELTLAYEGLRVEKSGGGGAIKLRSRHSSGYFLG
ncbi:phage tail protein [Scytonema hofmannii PCC 7110]|uniref:Phage tail protein n=1 Tax=Scytonema hofmannii PCC 7110 TaxID=128403 RepID=A0A139XC25_9CYAN|nr:phage tail protein [Scytonema hofmannii]KYC42247.1 phage tail protein [Scytonema hofmannii PCC 7110]